MNLGQPVFIKAKDDGGGGNNWTTGAILLSRAKLQSNHHHQQTNIQFLQAGCPSCRPTNSVKALKRKYHIPWTCLSQAHLEVFQLCLWPLIAPGYLGVGLPCLSSALWCQYPSLDSLLVYNACHCVENDRGKFIDRFSDVQCKCHVWFSEIHGMMKINNLLHCIIIVSHHLSGQFDLCILISCYIK